MNDALHFVRLLQLFFIKRKNFMDVWSHFRLSSHKFIKLIYENVQTEN